MNSSCVDMYCFVFFEFVLSDIVLSVLFCIINVCDASVCHCMYCLVVFRVALCSFVLSDCVSCCIVWFCFASYGIVSLCVVLYCSVLCNCVWLCNVASWFGLFLLRSGFCISRSGLALFGGFVLSCFSFPIVVSCIVLVGRVCFGFVLCCRVCFRLAQSGLVANCFVLYCVVFSSVRYWLLLSYNIFPCVGVSCFVWFCLLLCCLVP